MVAAATTLIAGCSSDPGASTRDHVKNGDAYLAKGAYPEAVVEYRNATSQDPQSAEAFVKLGDAFAALGEENNARAAYVSAAELQPDNHDAQMKAGNFLLLARRFRDAQLRARAALNIQPQNPAALVLMANALAGLKNLDEAVRANEQAIALDPARAASYTNLGALQFVAGRRDEARAAFAKAIELDPGSPDAYSASANYYWAVGKADESERLFRKAAALNPDDVAANRALAWLYLLTGRSAGAEPYFQAIARIEHNADSQVGLADYYLWMRRREDAVRILQPLTTNPSTFVRAKTRLALVEYTLGRRETAIAHMNEALERDPASPMALAFKSHVLLSERRVPAALESALMAVQSNPRSVEAQFALGRAYRVSGSPELARHAFNEVIRLKPDATDAHLELARLHVDRGEVDTAVMYAEQAISANPPDLLARLTLVDILMARDLHGQGTEAEVRKLLEMHPKSTHVHVTAGTMLLSRGDRVGARRAFERAAELGSVDALDHLLSLDIREQRTKDARTRIESVLARNLDSVHVLTVAAKTYAADGDVASAEGAFKKVIQMNPGHLQAYMGLASVYLRQRKVPEARAEFLELSKRRPSVESHTLVGILFEYEGNQAEAEKAYQAALQIDSGAAVAANNLAMIHAANDRNLDAALELAKMAHDKLPGQLDVTDTLGWIYYKKDMQKLAIPLLQQCVDGAPGNAIYAFHLGMAYAKDGDDSKARLALQSALKIQPDFAGAADARKTLASLVY